jgi:CMP-N-acetylneuraminic acid synthetase
MRKKGGLTIALIPARGGSKGINDKNIQPLLGKPLVAYAIECGLACPSIDHVIVSTDSRKIAKIAKRWGAEVPFLRPSELARDESPMLPVLQHAISTCEDYYKKRVEILVLLDPCSPMRSVEDVETCIHKFQKGNCDAVVSGCVAHRNPYFNMVVEEKGYIRLVIPPDRPIGRRQDCPTVYDLDTTVWVYSRRAIMDEKSRLPRRSCLYIVPKERSIHVESKLDLQILEFLMAKNPLSFEQKETENV